MVSPWIEARGWKSVEGLGRGFEFLPWKAAKPMHAVIFEAREGGGVGKGQGRESYFLPRVSTKVYHLPQTKISHLLQPGLDTPHPHLEQACTTMSCYLDPQENDLEQLPFRKKRGLDSGASYCQTPS